VISFGFGFVIPATWELVSWLAGILFPLSSFNFFGYYIRKLGRRFGSPPTGTSRYAPQRALGAQAQRDVEKLTWMLIGAVSLEEVMIRFLVEFQLCLSDYGLRANQAYY